MIRSATSKMSCRLCEMKTTARPCSASRSHELEHLPRLRDAERRRRLVEDDEARVPHHRARHGDRLALATGEARDGLPDRADRGHGEAFDRLGRLRLHHGLLEPREQVANLAAEVHVLDDVEVVAEREVLVDDLDPEPRRVLRAVDRDLLAVEVHVAVVDRVDPGDALDQRRLAGAVVADERHHLARADVEVDVGQRLDRAEALRDSRARAAGAARRSEAASLGGVSVTSAPQRSGGGRRQDAPPGVPVT